MAKDKGVEAVPAASNVLPSFWTILGIWFSIGGQSFGGGPSTIFLIRREFMVRRVWVTDEEYARYWVLCQLTPGVNIIALSVLIGRKLGGALGILASLIGLLLPSAVITTILAATFSAVQSWPPIQAMLRGITPATAGFSALVALQFVRPLLVQSWKESRASLSLSIFIILSCAALVGLLKLPVLYVLLAAGAVGAIGFAWVWGKGQVTSSK